MARFVTLCIGVVVLPVAVTSLKKTWVRGPLLRKSPPCS
jgi:hypothetical protein